MELPLLMSYLREGDKIVRREERRTAGMTFGPNEVKRITDCGAWLRTHNCSGIFVADYQLNDLWRLALSPRTLHPGDVLVRPTDGIQGVVAARPLSAATLVLPIQREKILVQWADLDSGWRMVRRSKPRKRRGGAAKPV